MKNENQSQEHLFQEINNLRKQVNELEQSEEKLKAIYELNPEGIITLDLKGVFTSCNPAFSRMTGYAEKDFLHKHFTKTPLFRKKDILKYIKLFSSFLKGKYPDIYEFNWVHKNKSLRTGEVFISTLKTNNRISGFLFFSRDISKRKKMEKKIKDYSENLERLVSERTQDLHLALQDAEGNRDKIDAILKSIGDGLIVTDTDNHIVLMNRVAEDITGVHLSNAINQTIDFVIQDSQLKDKIKSTLEKNDTGNDFDFELPGEDILLPRLIRARTTAFQDKAGNKIGIVTLMHDITYEREVDRMKTEFITAAAHELRTPLTSIRGFSEILMSSHHTSKEEREKFLTYINQQSVNLTAFINDLFDTARIDSGKTFSLKKVQTDAVDYFSKLISVFQDQNPTHKFKIKLPKTSVSVSIDQGKMKQAVNNLLSNAVKFSPNGELISVKGETKDSMFELSIKDQGIGLSPEHKKKVFDKFFKVDTSNTTLEGSGLGLNIAKYIIEAHGGQIWLESKIKKGTTVYLTIPL